MTPFEIPEGRNVAKISYWLLVLGVAGFVACLAPMRAEVIGADAWEHHRAVRTLSDEREQPQNPTFHTDVPSIRYSPYSFLLAKICVYAGVSPYDVLTAASVVNVVLVGVGLWLLLTRFDQVDCASSSLICMLFLYGAAPGYANSLALSDLPWHSLNPSMFSLGLNFIVWSLVARGRTATLAASFVSSLAAGFFLAVSVLCHAMTGVLGALGVVLLIGLRCWGSRSWNPFLPLVVVVPLSLLVCLAWPAYSFWDAVFTRFDNDYWFNPYVLKQMVFVWCAPAYLLALAALPYRKAALIQWVLSMVAAAGLLGCAAMLLRSPTLARLPLAVLPLACIAVGYWASELRLFSWSGARSTLSGLIALDRNLNAKAFLSVMLYVALAYGAIPQFRDIVSEPHLARKWVAKVAGREDKQLNLWQQYSSLLGGVEVGEVVLADHSVGWPVPSFGARVVSALHLELFVDDQKERRDQVETALASDSAGHEKAVVERYNVRYVLIDKFDVGTNDKIRKDAILAETQRFVLMDANGWLEVGARESINR